jgi:hypothetical protein
MSDELKKIYSKYFDDSGEMKPKGKAIMGEGLKGLSGPKTITEKGAFLPKAKDVVTKAAKASKYGKIAAGVAGAGLALKSYLKSKMSDDEVDKKSMGGETKLSPKQMKIARMAPPPNKITGADFKAMKASNGKMVMARGCKMGKNKPTKLS